MWFRLTYKTIPSIHPVDNSSHQELGILSTSANQCHHWKVILTKEIKELASVTDRFDWGLVWIWLRAETLLSRHSKIPTLLWVSQPCFHSKYWRKSLGDCDVDKKKKDFDICWNNHSNNALLKRILLKAPSDVERTYMAWQKGNPLIQTALAFQEGEQKYSSPITYGRKTKLRVTSEAQSSGPLAHRRTKT